MNPPRLLILVAGMTALVSGLALSSASAQEASTRDTGGRQLQILDLTAASADDVRNAVQATLRSQQDRLAPQGALTQRQSNVQLIVEIPTKATAVALLENSGLHVERSPTDSEKLRVLVSLGRSVRLTPEFAALVTPTNLASIDLRSLPRFGQPGIEQVIDGQVADALAASQLQSPGKFTIRDAAVGTSQCRELSREFALEQDLSLALADSESLERRSHALLFVTTCMSPVVTTGTGPPFLPKFVSDSGAVRILGMLELNETALCMAFLLDGEKVATARHCMYEAELAGTPLRDRWDGLASHKLMFRRLTPPFEAIPLDALADIEETFDPLRGGGKFEPIQPKADLIVLRLSRAIADAPLVTFARALDPRHAAWLAGPVSIDISDEGVPEDVPREARQVRWSSGTECSIYPQRDNCLAHVCQSIGSFSGAPLIVNSDDPSRIVIGGIHLGTYSSLGANCPPIGSPALISGRYTAERGSNGGVSAQSLLEYIAALKAH
jgi:hypothetical protein